MLHRAGHADPRGALVLALVLSSLSGAETLADVGGAPGNVAWNLDPAVLLQLALMGYLYQRGWMPLGPFGARRAPSRWRSICFVAGLLVLGLAILSPLDAMSADLSAAHMVQHMLVMNLAAPLLVLGSAVAGVLRGVPAEYRRPLGRMWRRVDAAPLHRPAFGWVAYAIALWGWHLPQFYQAALRHPVIHDLQHLTMFAAAFVFWRAVLSVRGRRQGPLVAIMFLFTTSLHATVLGVFMTLATQPWYADYVGRTAVWNLTPLEDQQLAGLIMWMPACLAYAVAAIGLLAVWLEKSLEVPDFTSLSPTHCHLPQGRSAAVVLSALKDRSMRSLWFPLTVALILGLWIHTRFMRPPAPATETLPAMPATISDAEARELYLTPAGHYTSADIEANGHLTAAQRYAEFRSAHDFHPQPGQPICPITRTKAHPQCAWVIGGQRYLFCCPPCIDEFVRQAKSAPERLPPPEEFIQAETAG